MRILSNIFFALLGSIQWWWAKAVQLSNWISVGKLPGDLSELFGGSHMNPWGLGLLAIGIGGLYLTNRDFWHGSYSHVSGQSSTGRRTGSKISVDKIRRWFERVSAGLLPKKISQVSLSEGLYVGEMRMSIDTLKADRYSEISIRVFNGTGRNIAIYGVGGALKFENVRLPSPSVTSNTAKTIFPLREWIIVLHQRVPADVADKMLSLLDENRALQILFGDLELAVRDENAKNPAERLKLWDGITIQRGINVGRIIFLQAHSGFRTETRGS
jgi:hypothetical protein